MRLDTTFIRLSLRVDADALATEVGAIRASAWKAHPEAAPGNTAVPLVATRGDSDDDSVQGPMEPTPILAQLPYVRSVLGALQAPIGRTRLMRVAGAGRLAPHVDTNRYWQEHLRVHVPVITDPSVRFTCEDETVHMAPGEVWVFDTWRSHGVDNPADFDRIHLVIDTVGSSALWGRIDEGALAGWTGAADGPMVGASDTPPVYERAAQPAVTSGWQHALLAQQLLHELGDRVTAELRLGVRDFLADWHAIDAAYGDDLARVRAFAARAELFDQFLEDQPTILLPNGTSIVEALRQHVVRPALAPSAHELLRSGMVAPGPAPAQAHALRRNGVDPGGLAPNTARMPQRERCREPQKRLDRPIFIVCPPRSGSTLMFETLARARGVFTIGDESHTVFESIDALHPANRGWQSNALGEEDVDADVVRRLEESFVGRALNRDGKAPNGLAPIRLLEKTPKNALRVPFLAAAFPDALFVYLHRDPRDSVSSMLDAWRSGRFVTYPSLPGWPAPSWSMLLVPGWRGLTASELPEVAAHQWATTTTKLLGDLQALDPSRWLVTTHEALLADPNAEAGRLCERLGLEWDRPVLGPLPLSKTTLDPPRAGKWWRNAREIEATWAIVEPAAALAEAVLAEPPAGPHAGRPCRLDSDRPVICRNVDAPCPPPGGDGHGGGRASDADESPFASVHTATLPELLHKAASSVIVSTYQSGRVIILRANDDGTLNTHLRAMSRPMGIAVRSNRIAVGTDQTVWDFVDRPAVAERLPGGGHDACFVPHRAHVTGDISIHEMAWCGDELWVVNTRFSCLATLDAQHSFVPRWRPPFVTALAAEDHCHLNGMAVVDGVVKYVTALGMTDDAQGWRRGKVGGGVVIDVETGGIVCQDLTMPHSPRWHDGDLWVLDSGRGTLCRVNLASGSAEPVAELPGFTRGLTFIGRYALVGLSKVREHVFAGLPLAERLSERSCGVWVVDVRTAEVVGFVRFDGAVEEIFDVQLVPGVRYPELLEPGDPLAASSFVLPDDALADVKHG